MKNIVILISGGGSNMAAIVRAAQQQRWEQHYGARVVAVVSNKPSAKGLDFARAQGIATEVLEHQPFPSREAFDAELARVIDRHTPTLVNIHPSLLPAFPGLHTHQRAIEAGCKFAGASVHLVTADLDAGPIIDQAIVPVLPGDDADQLAARVLTQEHLLYPKAIAQWLSHG